MKFDRKLGFSESAEGPMTKGTMSCGSRVPVSELELELELIQSDGGAFAEMSSDVGALADVTATALAAGNIQFLSISAVEARGMYKRRIRSAWGHTGRLRSQNEVAGSVFCVSPGQMASWTRAFMRLEPGGELTPPFF